jgi:hypothetical protein
MKTIWYESLFFNSIAISLSALSGLIYSHSVLREKDYEEKMKYYEYVITVLISLVTAFLIYLLIFFISGYVPMGKIR